MSYAIPNYRAAMNLGITLGADATTITYMNNWISATDCYITLQYTKTTDTAGSGTWTPQGVPAIHYSTDEQVVGTWVDGSTLYEITGILNEQITTTFKTIIDCTSLNINKVVNVSVTLFENGYYYGDATNMVSRYNPSTYMYEIRTTQYTYDSGAIATIRYTKQTS